MTASFRFPPNVAAGAAAVPVERTFDAMGTWCHVITHGGGSAACDDVVADITRLERAWTRFDADSELSRLNRDAGRWCRATPDTRRLLQHAVAGWRISGGLFDPFLADRMGEVGYDRDFADLRPQAPPSRWSATSRAVPSGGPVGIEPGTDRVRIVPGWEVDSGGLGKGLGADLAAAAALRRGVRSVLVNLGGDLRCAGRTPQGGWQVSLDDAWQPGQASGWSIRLQSGAVATSSTLRRSWVYPDGSAGHHLLDPRTGLPLTTDHAAVSVVARTAWLAEVLTKVVLLAPERLAARLVRRRQGAAIVTGFDGVRRQLA